MAVHPSTGSGRTEGAAAASGRTHNPVRVERVETRTLPGVLLFLFFSAAFAAAPAHFFDLNTGDLRAELADAKSQGRKAVMVFFEQEGCPGCRHMKENVFNVRSVQEYFHRNFVSLPLDIHGSVALKDPRGRDFTEKTYAQSLKVRATPTFIFYDLSGAQIVRIVGPLGTPEEFLLLGHFVTSGAYKSRTFAQFKREQPLSKGS
jgi:thioredoxin-related protein